MERSIRRIALDRKNALFVGSAGGAKRWAILTSLVETAKLNGMEPYVWLQDVLIRMIEGHPVQQIDALLPWHATNLTRVVASSWACLLTSI